jgi:hypothetical protein
MQYVRIVAKPTIDNPDAAPILVDTIVDETGRILGKHTLFGTFGSLERKEDAFYPFTLDISGKIDYGSDYDHGRFATFDLRDDKIIADRILTYMSPGLGTQRYRINKIILLPA